jgi:ATP adenylyltransferase
VFFGAKTVNHDIIWAPWRLGYILGESKNAVEKDTETLLPGAKPDCFLCQCVPESGDDLKHLVVHRNEHSVTVLNRYPYNNCHLLIAPRYHKARLDELIAAEQAALFSTITRMVGVMEKVLHPEGFNVGLNLGRAAGAGLPGHLHWHIVPRWDGDTSFMPTIAGARVIPQSLEAAWQMLREELAKTG